MPSVDVVGSRIVIRELILDDREAADVLGEVPAGERDSVAAQALRLGLILRRQAATAVNVDFVKLEFTRLKGEIEHYWQEHVVKPISDTITSNLDPNKGALPRFLAEYFGNGREAGKLAALFDERNTESITYKLRKMIEQELTGESSTFRKALDPDDEGTPIGRLKRKLEDGIGTLRDQVVGKKAADAVAEVGTQKGGPYEDLVFSHLDRIAAAFGDRAEDVSNQNVPGDYVVTLDSDTVPGQIIRLTLDAKDKSMGLKACEDVLREAKAQWQAQGALLIFARDEQTPFSPPVGMRKLSEGYACVFDKEDLDSRLLQAAYQVVRLEAVRSVQRSVVEVNPAVVQEKLEQAVQKLGEFVTLKRRLTASITELGNIRQFVDALHRECGEKLEEAWQALGIRGAMPAAGTEEM